MRIPLKLAALAAVSGLVFTTAANAAITLTTLTASDNFNTLPVTGTTPLDPTIGVVNALPGTGFVGTKTGGTGTTFSFIANDGSATSGALYSYGAIDDPERALGTLASGSTFPTFGVEIINGTGQTIASLELSGFREIWRTSTSAQNIVNAQFALGGGGIDSSNFLTAAGFTDIDSLDLVGPLPTATNGAVNGNDPANRLAISGVISGPVAPGQSVFLRFVDVNDAGNDAGLALDDFSIVAVVPEPTTVGLLGLAGLGMLRRRRA